MITQDVRKEVDVDTGVSGYFPNGTNIRGFEKNPKLSGTLKYNIYQEMRAQDPQVGGLLQLIRSALLNADREIIGGDDEQREWVKPIILDNLDQHLSAASLFVLFGLYSFEQVVGKDKTGRFYEKGLYPRQPWTITTWEKNEAGEVIGFKQNNGGASGRVPLDRAVMYINDSEGDNYEGVSLFRSCYGPYITKRELSRQELMSAQKVAVGNLVIKMKNSQTAQRAKAEDLAKAYVGSGSGYIIMDPNDGIESIDIQSYTGSVFDATSQKMYQDQVMSKSILAQFIDFGSKDKSGSYALVSEHIELFFDLIERIARNISHTINNQRIKRMIDWNWKDVTDYPKIQFSGFNEPDAMEFAQSLGILLPNGAIDLNEEDKERIRGVYGFPRSVKESKSAQGIEGVEMSSCGGGNVVHLSTDGGFWRELTALEQAVDFPKVEEIMESEKDALSVKVKELHDKLKDRYLAFLQPIVDRGDAAAVGELDSRMMVRQFRELLVGTAEGLFADGQDTVREEATKSGVTHLARAARYVYWLQNLPTDDPLAQAVIGIAEDEAEKIVSATATAAKQGARDAIMSGLIGMAATDAISNAIGSSTNRIVGSVAGSIVNQAFVNGRDSEARRMVESGQVSRTFYSAVLDGATCEVCMAADGAEVFNGQPPAPNPECYGHHGSVQNCRCVHVYEFNV